MKFPLTCILHQQLTSFWQDLPYVIIKLCCRQAFGVCLFLCGVPYEIVSSLIMTDVFTWPPLHCVWQGEEGPPSLEYIKAKDLFPQKELVKEDESLQVCWPLFIWHRRVSQECSRVLVSVSSLASLSSVTTWLISIVTVASCNCQYIRAEGWL